MLTRILLCCSLCTLLLAARPVASVPPASTPIVQDDDDAGVVDKRPEVKELLERLKGHAGKRGAEDREAIGIIDKLLVEFSGSGPKDRASIVTGIGKCFDQKRKDLDDGIPDNKLYLACAVSLGEMGKNATKTILKWVGHKRYRKDIGLQRTLIFSLGKTKDPAAVEPLLKLLNNKNDTLIGAAAESLGEFVGEPQKTRKKIVNEILKLLMTTKAMKDGDPNDITSRNRYDVIAAPIITTLQVLSGHDERAPDRWQRWWNKNKKADWDEED